MAALIVKARRSAAADLRSAGRVPALIVVHRGAAIGLGASLRAPGGVVEAACGFCMGGLGKEDEHDTDDTGDPHARASRVSAALTLTCDIAKPCRLRTSAEMVRDGTPCAASL